MPDGETIKRQSEHLMPARTEVTTACYWRARAQPIWTGGRSGPLIGRDQLTLPDHVTLGVRL